MTAAAAKDTARTGWWRSWFQPVTVGARQLPPIGLVVFAAIGASLLVIVAATEWLHFNDEHAYWLAAARLWSGQPLYDPTAAPDTPFAYWYPPPLAQLLAPATAILSPDAFSVLWTALLLACLWWLGGRNPLVALALIAFLPVAVELRVRNVHLVIAVLIVLALRRGWAFWVPAAAIKITPVLGCAYLAAAGRWRDAVKVGVAGLGLLAVSVALGPGAWREFLDVVGARAGTDGGSLVPIPFVLRFAVGAVLAVAAGRVAGGWVGAGRIPGAPIEAAGMSAGRTDAAGMSAGRTDAAGTATGRAEADAANRVRNRRVGEALLVIGLTIANPTFWATALSLLIAIVPLWRSAPQPEAARDG